MTTYLSDAGTPGEGAVVIVHVRSTDDAESLKILHEYVNGLPGSEDREPISVAEAILFGVRMTAQALTAGRGL